MLKGGGGLKLSLKWSFFRAKKYFPSHFSVPKNDNIIIILPVWVINIFKFYFLILYIYLPNTEINTKLSFLIYKNVNNYLLGFEKKIFFFVVKIEFNIFLFEKIQLFFHIRKNRWLNWKIQLVKLLYNIFKRKKGL